MKLSQALWGLPSWAVMVEKSDRMWFTGGGNGNPFQYSCPKNPMTSMKRQKDMRKVSPPGWKVSNMLLGKN